MGKREHVGHRNEKLYTTNVNRHESLLDSMTRLKGIYYRITES